MPRNSAATIVANVPAKAGVAVSINLNAKRSVKHTFSLPEVVNEVIELIETIPGRKDPEKQFIKFYIGQDETVFMQDVASLLDETNFSDVIDLTVPTQAQLYAGAVITVQGDSISFDIKG